jgi:BirA family transcriptional regulator, biotin operon repressor / biotin---[acetyl-CoA-carboxylase] ligase
MAASAQWDGTQWPFVRSMIVLDEVDSTSDRAAKLVRDGNPPLPLCVWAKRQTRGRGRGSHSWWSDSGSLTFTLAIDPNAHAMTPETEPKLALATAVAVIEALIELGFDSPALGIRWPNDIVINGRKLGGILPENIATAHGRRILIGVGLNVATDWSAMPPEIQPQATSLSASWSRPIDKAALPDFLAMILNQLGPVLGRLAAKDLGLVQRWNDLNVLNGEWVKVDVGPRIVAGWGRAIEEDGSLCLDDGRQWHRVIGGQVLR